MGKYYIYRYDSDTEESLWVIGPDQEFEAARTSARAILRNEATNLDRVLLVEDDAPTEEPYLMVGIIAQAGLNGDDVRLINYQLKRA